MKALIAVDLHDHPEEVLSRAADWGMRLHASIDVVYVNPWTGITRPLTSPRDAALLAAEWDRIRAHDYAKLDALAKEELPEECRGLVLVLEGDPATVLASLTPGYDALIVGTHGRQGLKRLWLGSVAETVVRKSMTPVVVVPAPRAAAV